jgi:hypothetical protein
MNNNKTLNDYNNFDIEKTKNEFNTKWLSKRYGKITGTKVKGLKVKPRALKTVIKNNTLNDAELELLSEQLSTYDFNMGRAYHNAMERGHYLEPIAVKEYNRTYKDTLKQIDYELIQNDDDKSIAVSPDSILINKTGDILRAGEVKCYSPKEHLKRYIELYMNKGIAESLPEFNQVIQYFCAIKTLKDVTLIFYNPDMKIESLRLFTCVFNRSDYISSINNQSDLELDTLDKVRYSAGEIMLDVIEQLKSGKLKYKH